MREANSQHAPPEDIWGCTMIDEMYRLDGDDFAGVSRCARSIETFRHTRAVSHKQNLDVAQVGILTFTMSAARNGPVLAAAGVVARRWGFSDGRVPVLCFVRRRDGKQTVSACRMGEKRARLLTS